jgi:hypothetical protein
LGSDSEDNLIALCLECHANTHHIHSVVC